MKSMTVLTCSPEHELKWVRIQGRKGLTLAGGCVFAAIVVYCWAATQGPNVADWPELPAFSCRQCGRPAAIDPGCIERWACRGCGVMTCDLWEHFEPVNHLTPDWHAAGRGEITEPMVGRTPAEAWSRDRRRHW